MKKKITGALLGLMLLNASVGSAIAKSFSDMTPAHWAYQQVQSLSNEGIVVGYPDGTFRPDIAATRAEFATMVIKALQQENSLLTDTYDFSDVSVNHWAYDMIQRAYAFDLIKGFPDGTFRPTENVSKAEAIAIMISAVNTGDMTSAQAKEALKNYTDVNEIPDWALVPAGKAEKLKVTAHPPYSANKFNPENKITRAEIAVSLYNMKKEALINPNRKLLEAMTPKKAEGIVIDGVTVNGTTATLPAGTVLPVDLLKALSSQSTETGEMFLATTSKNMVTKESYLLVSQGSNFLGEVTSVKPGRLFIRNGKLGLDIKYISTSAGQKADFAATVDQKQFRDRGIMRVIRFFIKGKKINLSEGKTVYIKLTKPVKIDLTNTRVTN